MATLIYKGYTVKFSGNARVTKAKVYDATGNFTRIAAYGCDQEQALQRVKNLLDTGLGVTRPLVEKEAQK